MPIVLVILDQSCTFIALASLILVVWQVGLMRTLSPAKVGKGDTKPWNTVN
jgi:hypothetical protein